MPTVNTALDINITNTHNIRTIGVADVSIYKPNLTISGATLEITPPGFRKVALGFTPNSINVFNSNNLQLTNSPNQAGLAPLPDGLWTIKYSIAPSLDNFVEITFIRTDLIECSYANVKLGMDLSDCASCESNHKLAEELREIRMLIDGAVASGNQCDETMAMYKYRKAFSKLKRIKQCECK